MSKTSGPKIISFDLETAPDMDRAFERWTSLSKWYGITFSADLQSIWCFGYKVLGKPARVLHAWDFPAWKVSVNADKDLCKAAYDILKDADVIVTQNGKDFDFKVLQTRLLFHGLPPLPNILHIDTKIEAKRHLKLSSNSLANIAELFTEDRKMENGGWKLWVDVKNRDPKAMRTMSRYCKQDVVVLEKIFNRLRPLIRGLPNANMWHLEQTRCPSCSSLSLQKRGQLVKKESIGQRWQCLDCGSWSQTTIRKKVPSA